MSRNTNNLPIQRKSNKLMTNLLVKALTVSLLSSTLFAGLANAAKSTECTFRTSAAHYASTRSPGEEFSFKWDKKSGRVTSLSWVNEGNKWFSFAADPGQVTIQDNYYAINLGLTTTGFESTRFSILGYMAPKNLIVLRNDYTLAGIYEGTGTAWFVGYGKISPASCLLTP